MTPLVIWRGHTSSTTTLTVITVALVSIISGTLSVAISSTEKANELKTQGHLTTDLVQRINTLDGIATYSFLVVAISVVVALLLLAAIIQFTVASASSTIRSLRVYGISRNRVRLGFVGISLFASVLALLFAVILAPGAGAIHRYILSLTGLDVSDVSIHPSYSAILWTTISIAIFASLVSYTSSKRAASLENSSSTQSRWVTRVRLVTRVTVFIGVVIGLVAILRVNPTMENVNEITFGAMFTSLIAAWCVFPLLVNIVGRIIKSFGSVGLAAGGLMAAESRRISGIALISALLLGLGGTSAMLTLASSSAGQYLAMTSVSADAVTNGQIKRTAPDVEVSSFNYDNGWLLKDEEAKQAPVILFNPEVFRNMLKPGTIKAGDLQSVNGTHVAADAQRYKLGDTIPIVNDDGRTLELKVVALSDPESLLGGAIGADSKTFSPSNASKIDYRTYATSDGGLHRISEAFPEADWKTIQQFVDDDLRSAQASQMASVFSMIGGVSLVAFFGLLYSVIGFSVDQRRSAFSLSRMGMGRVPKLSVFAFIGCAVAVSSAILAACGLLAALRRVSDILGSLGVTYPLNVPWGMLITMWALIAVAAVLGMVAGQRRTSKLHGRS